MCKVVQNPFTIAVKGQRGLRTGLQTRKPFKGVLMTAAAQAEAEAVFSGHEPQDAKMAFFGEEPVSIDPALVFAKFGETGLHTEISLR